MVEETVAVEEGEVTFSKALSWMLRHGALELGLSMRSDAYVPISEILEQ